MPRTVDDFGGGIGEASLSVLLELWTILGAYREAMVLIGGWTPYFILKQYQEPDNPFQHVGSIDIDVALNPAAISRREYATIAELITRRGYRPRLNRLGKPIEFAFEREIDLSGATGKAVVEVDFLAPEYGGTGRSRRHQVVQDDLLARKARGADVVFEHNFSFPLAGFLPNGAEVSAEIRVADVVGCLTTKGMAIGQRYAEKDAYDIYAVVANYKGGPRDVAAEVAPFLGNSLIQEAMGNIANKFQTIRASGPLWVADFLGTSAEERERIAADAYAQVATFLETINLNSRG
jgi:hypothetical protein